MTADEHSRKRVTVLQMVSSTLGPESILFPSVLSGPDTMHSKGQVLREYLWMNSCKGESEPREFSFFRGLVFLFL